MTRIEITGWNAENESVEGSGEVREDETVEDAITRIAEFWWIVEIGDVTVYGERS